MKILPEHLVELEDLKSDGDGVGPSFSVLDHAHFVSYVGSRLHGLHRQDSDVDLYVVVQLPDEYTHPTRHGYIHGFDRLPTFRSQNLSFKGKDGLDYDVTVVSMPIFMAHLTSGRGHYAIESLLFANDNSYQSLFFRNSVLPKRFDLINIGEAAESFCRAAVACIKENESALEDKYMKSLRQAMIKVSIAEQLVNGTSLHIGDSVEHRIFMQLNWGGLDSVVSAISSDAKRIIGLTNEVKARPYEGSVLARSILSELNGSQ